MWGIRVVVPQKLRQRVLEELHTSHMGMNKMKVVARSFVWWPLIDKEIEQLATCKSCDACLSVRHSPPHSPLHPWSLPTRPWQRVSINFAGPLFGKTYLVVTPNGLKSGKYHLHLHLQQLMFYDTFFQFSSSQTTRVR